MACHFTSMSLRRTHGTPRTKKQSLRGFLGQRARHVEVVSRDSVEPSEPPIRSPFTESGSAKTLTAEQSVTLSDSLSTVGVSVLSTGAVGGDGAGKEKRDRNRIGLFLRGSYTRFGGPKKTRRAQFPAENGMGRAGREDGKR